MSYTYYIMPLTQRASAVLMATWPIPNGAKHLQQLLGRIHGHRAVFIRRSRARVPLPLAAPPIGNRPDGRTLHAAARHQHPSSRGHHRTTNAGGDRPATRRRTITGNNLTASGHQLRIRYLYVITRSVVFTRKNIIQYFLINCNSDSYVSFFTSLFL